MNIFRTNSDPVISADEMCNIHLTKMISEYAQLMSCCHRRLDGFGPLWLKHNGNDRKWWLHLTDTVDEKGKLVRLTGYVLLAGVNMEHPALDWVCQGRDNYTWLFRSWERLLDNFKRVRGKPHEYEKLFEVLFDFPENLPEGGTRPCKFVYPEFRHIQSVEEAYHAHINHKLTLPFFRDAHFEVKTPTWLKNLPPKSYTQKIREQNTGVDEGTPKPPTKKAPSFGAPPGFKKKHEEIREAADRVISIKKEKPSEKDKPLKVIKNGPPKFKVPKKE